MPSGNTEGRMAIGAGALSCHPSLGLLLTPLYGSSSTTVWFRGQVNLLQLQSNLH